MSAVIDDSAYQAADARRRQTAPSQQRGSHSPPRRRSVYERLGVVLYACASCQDTADAVLARARHYAVEHGWEVVGEFSDVTGMAPAKTRQGFRDAVHVIEAGQAHGLVTKYRAMVAPTDAEYAQLDAKLKQLTAFLVATWEMQYR
jgi:hypothetical protein